MTAEEAELFVDLKNNTYDPEGEGWTAKEFINEVQLRLTSDARLTLKEDDFAVAFTDGSDRVTEAGDYQIMVTLTNAGLVRSVGEMSGIWDASINRKPIEIIDLFEVLPEPRWCDYNKDGIGVENAGFQFALKDAFSDAAYETFYLDGGEETDLLQNVGEYEFCIRFTKPDEGSLKNYKLDSDVLKILFEVKRANAEFEVETGVASMPVGSTISVDNSVISVKVDGIALESGMDYTVKFASNGEYEMPFVANGEYELVFTPAADSEILKNYAVEAKTVTIRNGGYDTNVQFQCENELVYRDGLKASDFITDISSIDLASGGKLEPLMDTHYTAEFDRDVHEHGAGEYQILVMPTDALVEELGEDYVLGFSFFEVTVAPIDPVVYSIAPMDQTFGREFTLGDLAGELKAVSGSEWQEVIGEADYDLVLLDESGAEISEAKDAGIYTVRATLKQDSGYRRNLELNANYSVEFTFTIEKARIVRTDCVEGSLINVLTYDGYSHPIGDFYDEETEVLLYDEDNVLLQSIRMKDMQLSFTGSRTVYFTIAKPTEEAKPVETPKPEIITGKDAEIKLEEMLGGRAETAITPESSGDVVSTGTVEATEGGSGHLHIVFNEEYKPQDYEVLDVFIDDEEQGNSVLVCALPDENGNAAQRSLMIDAARIARMAENQETEHIVFENGNAIAEMDVNDLLEGDLTKLMAMVISGAEITPETLDID